MDLTTPSIRVRIQQALVERLATATGWDVQLRGRENASPALPHAIVYQIAESKDVANNLEYSAVLEIGVLVVIRPEEEPTETNPYLQLDRAISAVEQVIHSPDSWGLDPDFTDVQILGHEVSEPTEDTEPMGWVRLQFKYRHNIETPQF